MGVPGQVVGRYQLFGEIASGGMATVHYGLMLGPAGFARTVAIKRLHAHLSKAPEFVAMIIDEARVAARIRHPNIVSTLELIAEEGEALLVMDYVHGATLAQLIRESPRRIPLPIAVGIVAGALYGLHAAHEAVSETGALLGVVHRDVSPQNIIVGADGIPRAVDFGIAKAVGRLQTTTEGELKGKSGYMSPEQIRGHEVDRRSDVYSASVVLWEAVTGERLFSRDNALATMNAVLEKTVPPASRLRPEVPAVLDAAIAKGLARDPDKRFATAREMAIALEAALPVASTREIGEWVESVAGATLAARAREVAEMEATALSVKDVPISSRRTGTAVNAPPSASPMPATMVTGEPTTTSQMLPEPRRSRGLLIFAGLGIVTLGAFALVLGVRSAGHENIPVAKAPEEPTVATPPPPASPSPPVSVAPATSATTPASAVSSVAPVTNTARAVTTSPRPRRPDCNPPYTIDADGTRHWKKGC